MKTPPKVRFDNSGSSGVHSRATATLQSLRLLAVLAVVLPLFAYAIVGYDRYRKLVQETGVRLDRALRVAQEHTLKVMDTTEVLLGRIQDTAVASNDELARQQFQVHQQLRAMAENKPQLQGIWIFGADGRAIVTSRAFPAPDVSAVERDDFRHHQQGAGGLYVSPPLVERSSGEAFFDVSAARAGPNKEFAGVVSVSLRLLYFEHFYQHLSADEPGLAINLFRSDGTIFMRYPPVPEAPARLAPNSPVMSRIGAGRSDGIADGVSSVDGRLRLLRYARIGTYPIYVGTGMDTAVIRERWLREMGWLAAFGLPPLLGLLLAARLALRRTRDALVAADRLSDETQARVRVEEALLQSQKLEALGRLTGGVAHDFNNALMVISNNLFLLAHVHPQLDGVRFQAIRRAVGSATQLTRQLLAFSRRQPLVPVHVVLQERLPTLCDLLAPVLGSQIALHIEVAPDTRPILVDEAELELGLINPAINARDAMPAGGRFTLRVANATQPPALLNGEIVVIDAVDSGTGIPADQIDKVFEPFFTTKPVGEGTGLGLSQVYGLCQRAGGLATIDSEPGRGTRVRLFFAATDEAPAAPARAQPAPHTELGLRVVLVEDNEAVATGLRAVLETMGCLVQHIERADAARDWLALHCGTVDLLLTDVVMPGDIDGLALAQGAREQCPHLRIVLMTGYAEQVDAIAQQGFVIVPKPCSAEMLATAIRRAGASPAGEGTAAG